MHTTPQKVEQDVLIGPHQAPPSGLMMVGCHNSLLEHLTIPCHRPIPVVVIRDMGIVQQH